MIVLCYFVKKVKTSHSVVRHTLKTCSPSAACAFSVETISNHTVKNRIGSKIAHTEISCANSPVETG